MQWTPEKVAQVPEVYQDFMWTLKPILDSRSRPFLIRGIPMRTIFHSLRGKYGIDPMQLHQLAQVLEKQGLVKEDRFGSFNPTAEGESFIQQLAAGQEVVPFGPPPFPRFEG
jgi:hypothetical protein